MASQILFHHIPSIPRVERVVTRVHGAEQVHGQLQRAARSTCRDGRVVAEGVERDGAFLHVLGDSRVATE